MKTIDDFVLWSLNIGCTSISDINKKLYKYGFNESEIEKTLLSLQKNNKLTIYTSGNISLKKVDV